MLNYSISEENYIKTIFHLQQEKGLVTTNELAKDLQTTAASVTDMIKKLKLKKILHYQPYQGFRLSSSGKKVALDIIRRHRLWEYFLAEKLKFSWEEVHTIADQLEHVSNNQLIERLDEYLGFPRTDPHGDPIPDATGKITDTKHACLTEILLNQQVQVSHVSDQSTEVLDLLSYFKIAIGSILSIKKKFDYDLSLEIQMGSEPSFNISGQLAQHIFVIPKSRKN